MSAPWAEYHLRTAGAYLDTLDPGRDGAPKEAANIVALENVPAHVFGHWVHGEPLQLALVAQAARHVPVDLLVKLMGVTEPTDEHAPWPEEYAILDTLPALMRDAIEAKGSAAIPGLLAHPTWAKDRGFDNPSLAWAFPAHRKAVRQALTNRQDSAAKEALSVWKTGLDANFRAQLVAALESDHTREAARLAVAAAVRWMVNETKTLPADAARLTCATLDGAAVAMIRSHRLLAAEAHLRLAGAACGDRQIYRERVADLFAVMGEESVGRGDFESALPWFKGAHHFGHRAIDKARLADTLAEVSLLRFKEGDVVSGSAILDAAQAIDGLRPRVVEAAGVRPKADPRAKLGIFVIIVFLGLFAVRRLRKVWSIGGDRGRGLKRRR